METRLSEDQRHGMFYFAERQEPRAPRKMETPLSEDQWNVPLRSKTGRQLATHRKMETHFLKRNGMFYFAK